MSPETDIAYAAGLIDGEGCFSISRSQDTTRTRLEVCMTDRTAVEWLYERFGGVILERERQDGAWEDQITWRLNKREDIAVLTKALFPYLKTKRLPAILMLEFCKEFPLPPSGCKLPEETKEAMLRYCEFMNVANARGAGAAKRKAEFLSLIVGESS